MTIEKKHIDSLSQFKGLIVNKRSRFSLSESSSPMLIITIERRTYISCLNLKDLLSTNDHDFLCQNQTVQCLLFQNILVFQNQIRYTSLYPDLYFYVGFKIRV